MKMDTSKKITRGLNSKSENSFAIAFKNCELYELYKLHKDELFIGVRNNYLNLYYNCDSIAKITYVNNSICCTIDKYYLDGNHYGSKDKEKRHIITPKEISNKYEKIKENSNKKVTPEKKAQAKLVLLNNKNTDSKWYCVDVEYVKQFNNKQEKKEAEFNGRFDIIALSKAKPHRVALIELKYGSGAIGGKSGISKHVEDFTKFCNKNYFQEHLKNEIIEIIESQRKLGISVPFDSSYEFDKLTPEFYFITLDNNALENSSTPKQTMAGYLFNDKRWGCKRLSTKVRVQSMFGDVLSKSNTFCATFLFSKANLNDIGINDIIDGDYDERIIPV